MALKMPISNACWYHKYLAACIRISHKGDDICVELVWLTCWFSDSMALNSKKRKRAKINSHSDDEFVTHERTQKRICISDDEDDDDCQVIPDDDGDNHVVDDDGNNGDNTNNITLNHSLDSSFESPGKIPFTIFQNSILSIHKCVNNEIIMKNVSLYFVDFIDNKKKLLTFLDSCTLDELKSVPKVSKKAESIFSMKPFESWEDMVCWNFLFMRSYAILMHSILCLCMNVVHSRLILL